MTHLNASTSTPLSLRIIDTSDSSEPLKWVHFRRYYYESWEYKDLLRSLTATDNGQLGTEMSSQKCIYCKEACRSCYFFLPQNKTGFSLSHTLIMFTVLIFAVLNRKQILVFLKLNGIFKFEIIAKFLNFKSRLRLYWFQKLARHRMYRHNSAAGERMGNKHG